MFEGIRFDEVFCYTFTLMAFIIVLIPSKILFNKEHPTENKKEKDKNDK